MSRTNSERIEVLNTLFDLTVDDLLKRVRSGQASHQELSLAIKLLSDNGIEVLPEASNPLGDLVDELSKVKFTEEHVN